jgi:hypothetical protein
VETKEKELLEVQQELQNEKNKTETIEKEINEIIKPTDNLMFSISKFIQMMKVFESNRSDIEVDIQKKVTSNNVLEAFNKRLTMNSQVRRRFL